ncbi:MAG: ribonuclease PH [Deltaproteobacteria bacterium]|nr:ribonuclease PH [Deltaproteobacteria bacterium]
MPKRQYNQLRALSITPHYLAHPEGSALIECGDTKVICTASIEETVPKWMSGKGRGWITAEYDMLPRATSTRNQRDSHKGKINGRTQEISRLIGRSLRATANMALLGERSIMVDCDVIQADGGTRTASITGGYVALALAIKHLIESNKLKPEAMPAPVTAISVGIINNEPYLDLDYELDSRAEVDMNVVMTGAGEFVEVQGTGEGHTFKRESLDILLDLALGALPTLIDIQQRAIATPLSEKPLVINAK